MAGPNGGAELREALKNVGSVDIDEKSGRVVINSNVPWVEIQEKIENTGRRAVLSGFGGKLKTFHTMSVLCSVCSQAYSFNVLPISINPVDCISRTIGRRNCQR